MSLAETQQIFAVLEQINALLNNINITTDKIVAQTPKMQETTLSLREGERMAIRYLSVIRSMGLPDNANAVITTFTRLIVILRMAQMTLLSLGSGGAYGTLMGIAGFMLTTNAVTNFTQTLGE